MPRLRALLRCVQNASQAFTEAEAGLAVVKPPSIRKINFMEPFHSLRRHNENARRKRALALRHDARNDRRRVPYCPARGRFSFLPDDCAADCDRDRG